MKQSRLGKVMSHGITLLLGILLTFGSLRVMSSQADMIAQPSDSILEQEILDRDVKPVRASTSFVSAAIAKTGPAVVRVDTERTVSRRVELFLTILSFKNFLAIALVDKFLKKDR